MSKHVKSMIEGISGMKVSFPGDAYGSRDQISKLTNEELGACLDHWHSMDLPIKPIHTWSKRIRSYACMGLPLQNEVERRWRLLLKPDPMNL